MKNENILKILSSVKAEAKRRYKAEIMGLFGSHAKGSATRDSDVDILVRFEGTADLFDLVGLSFFLEEMLHCKVDVVPKEDIRSELKESILKETIYI
jgi:predicted nucleotidyltransferase